jgi:hypothetical protein
VYDRVGECPKRAREG